jgi:sugar lactone lactonase YvrE
MARKLIAWLLGLLGVGALYLFSWPVPIDPVDWQAPDAPALAGDYAENKVLQRLELYPTPDSNGPEDVAVDADGRVYVGVKQGKILRYAPDGANPEVFASTGGRPLGLDFDNDGNLIVADADKGLLSVDPAGTVSVLCTEAGGERFGFTDDVDVDSQNVAWFSDASTRWDHHHVNPEAVLESGAYGRLVRYDIGSGECSVVLSGLYFANGVAVSPDETYVLVNETWRYRTKRVYVRGPRQGVVETWAENLPGFPDGISTGADGIYWLAIFAPRNEIVDNASTKPWLRKLLFRLPKALSPKPRKHPFVVGFDEDGKVVHNLQDADGLDFSHSTSAEQVGDWLYVGSLMEPKWGRIPLSALE